MPRRKFSNKGRLRQFTPADELEQERRGPVAAAPNVDEVPEEEERSSSHSRGVHGLIEVSNPNRAPRERPPSMNVGSKNIDQQTVDDATLERRRERRRERLLCQNMVKSSQTESDLARLAVVRREREAAAQRRLAVKKAAAAASAAGSETSLKRIGPKSQQDNSSQEVLGRGYQRKSRNSRKK